MNSQERPDLNLSAYWLRIQQHWAPAASIFAVIFILACLSTLLLKPTYRAEGKMRFKVDRTSVLEGVEKDATTLEPLVATQNPLNTEIEVIHTKPLLKRVISTLALNNVEGEELKPKELLSQLDISIIGGTDVLKISHESKDPQESALIVNTLMQTYLKNSLQNRRSEANEARKFIADQLPISERTVQEAETEISNFKDANNIVDLDAESEAAVAEIARLDREINVSQVAFDEVVARSSALKNQVGLSSREATAISNLSQSSEVQEVLKELQAVERQLAAAREIYQEEYPEIIDLRSKRNALKALLLKSQAAFRNQPDVSTVQVEVGDPQQSSINDFLIADVDRKALAIRLESLVQRRAFYDNRVKMLPQLRQTLRELERKLTAAQSTYELLLTKRQELQVAENSNAQNAEIIEPALVPTSGTILKRKMMIVAFGTLLGAFLATASIPFFSWRQRLEKSPSQLETSLGYPVWAVIPYLRGDDDSGDRDPDTLLPVMNEMHRMLRTYPEQLLEGEHPLRTLVITSTDSHEGRSTIAANLASAMAQVGKKVLLIDADMRNPRQHEIFELASPLGLSDVFNDEQIRFDEVKMIISPVMDNLDILTSGTQAIRTIYEFNRERMETLLQYCTSNYDIVLLDTPPLLDSDSTAIIGQLVDGVLLVTYPAVMNDNKMSAVKECIATNKLNIVGMVVNGSQTSHSQISGRSMSPSNL